MMPVWLSQQNWQVLSHFASRISLVVLVVILGWLSGVLLTQFLQPPLQLVLPTVKSDELRSSVLSNGLPSIELLGRQEESHAQQVQKVVTETRLNLKVLGTVVLPDDKGVLIVQSGGKTWVVSVGEKIQDGVYLVSVYSDHAVIDHNGILEKLLMNDENALLNSEVFGSSEQFDSSTRLSRLKEELKASPMSIMQYVRFQLVNAGKPDVRMKLWPKKEGKLFEELGLEKGDVLLSVNGRSIAQLTQTPRLWLKVLNEPVLEMEIERQGQLEYLVVELK